MTNNEFPMSKEIRMTKSEMRLVRLDASLSWELRHSFVIR